jgi:hypothetical protein
MAYRFTLFPPRARVSVLGASLGLDLPLQIAIRPTDFCHPTNLSTCTRARGSRPTSRPRGMSPVARWIEGHDVSRRRRPLPPDRTLRPRVFTGVASCDRASDTPVARSWGRAALLRRLRLRSLEPRPPSPSSVKKKGDGTIRCAFLRQDARATERVVDPDPGLATWMLSVNVHGVVRPTITSSSRAPGRAPCDAVREVHPRPSPRLPVCCPTAGVGAGLLADRLSARSPGVSNGLLWACDCLPISATHFDARARPRAVNPPPREASASCPRLPSPGGCPLARDLPVVTHRRDRCRPRPLSCLRSLYRPGWSSPSRVDTGERATSFSRRGCSHPSRVLLVRCEGGDRHRPSRARPGFLRRFVR